MIEYSKMIKVIQERMPDSKLVCVSYSPSEESDKLNDIFDRLMLGVFNYNDIIKTVSMATDATDLSFGQNSYHPASVSVYDGLKFPDEITVYLKPNQQETRDSLKYARKEDLQRLRDSETGRMMLWLESLESILHYKISSFRFEDKYDWPHVELNVESFDRPPSVGVYIDIGHPGERDGTPEETINKWVDLLKELDLKPEVEG